MLLHILLLLGGLGNTKFMTHSLGLMSLVVPWSRPNIKLCLKKRIISCEKRIALLQNLKDL